jgi:hypothetical protein
VPHGLERPLQPLCRTVENACVNPSFLEEDEVVPEHLLASLYGLCALALGATVWSAMAAVFGAWSLPAAPGLGWLIAWACRYGGRRTDAFVRSAAWVLACAGALLALLVFSAFSVTQTSPDSGFQIRAVGLEYLRLFAEPPWFGSAALLLALAGTWRVLDERRSRRGVRPLEQAPARSGMEAKPRALRTALDDPDSRAA